jgi:hypothetical protein
MIITTIALIILGFILFVFVAGLYGMIKILAFANKASKDANKTNNKINK